MINGKHRKAKEKRPTKACYLTQPKTINNKSIFQDGITHYRQMTQNTHQAPSKP
jgi:hypothetical protein